ncbi:unnamed protein product [Larinioides sclopetarius]|uniref:PIPK domain-containing protein n=1 Tax=Larinioides sclopetarius TaxID=280406 RepID=A0AAV2A6N8_9ARAC
MSFDRTYENLRSKDSPSFRIIDSSHHGSECLFQEPKIPLDPVFENIEELCEETRTTNGLKKKCEDAVKTPSSKQATNALRESPSNFLPLYNSHREAECLFQEPEIPLLHVIGNIEKSCEETETTNGLKKGCEDEVKISSNKQTTNILRESPSSFQSLDGSHREAECLFQEPKIPLVPVIENIDESGEESGTTTDSRKECEDEVKISSCEQSTSTLKELPSNLQSLDFKVIWSDALIPDLQPSAEIAYDLKPKADSLILDLVRRGIEVSLDQLDENQKRDVLLTDFSTVEKIIFTRTGPNSATRNFTFCVHAPIAFQFFRDLFGISTECFRNSICKEPFCQLDGYSQSGSMYTSYDDRFLLKICQKKEAAFLEKLFSGYFSNVTKHPKTLLPKFFGLYGYKEGNIHVHFLIMNNLVPIFVNLHEKYDLKGSTYSKRKSEKFQKTKPSTENQENLGPLITLKDLDFLQRWPDGLYLKQKFYSLLMQAVERDCKILQSYEIMDYSLLVGIHVPGNIYWSYCEDHSSTEVYKISKLEAARVRKIKNLIGPFEARTSKGCRIHLYLGIIDILQSYTVIKKCEHFFKFLLYPSNTMSVVKPDMYAERFKNFLKQSVFKCIPELISFQKKEKELIQKLLEDFPDDAEI